MFVTPESYRSLPQAEKIRNYAEMPGIVHLLQKAGIRVVLAQGVFDIVHAGHVGYLRATAAEHPQPSAVIIGVENDASVQKNKGTSRPINPLEDRLTVLTEFVSAHLVFAYPNVPDYANPHDFIDRYSDLHPDAISVAAFDPHFELKSRQAREAGTQLAPVQYQHENSTTRMLQRLGHQE